MGERLRRADGAYTTKANALYDVVYKQIFSMYDDLVNVQNIDFTDASQLISDTLHDAYMMRILDEKEEAYGT